MAKVLLFNIPGSRLSKLRMLLLRAGIACRIVAPAEQFMTIGQLAGLSQDRDMPESGVPFTGEMMVMCDLSEQRFNFLLDSMRSAGLIIPLKAVLTESNSKWSAVRLHKELAAEHEAMKIAGKAGIHR